MKTTFLLFAFLLVNILQAQNLEWARQFGGLGNDQSNSITTDAAGNVYTCGSFNGIVDFNPGPAVVSLTSAGGTDIFITKINPSGNLVWVKQIGGVSTDQANSVFVDLSGNIYVTGSFSQIVDFDPGPGTYLQQASPLTYILPYGGTPPTSVTGFTQEDIFILKLDFAGNFVWVKRIGGSGDDFGKEIRVDAVGNVYTIGFFSDFRYWIPFNLGFVDFDPGPGEYNLSPGGGFILKLDPSGNFVWAKQLGQGAGGVMLLFQTVEGFPAGFITLKWYSVTINSFDLDQEGNVYITGKFQYNNNDFDPGPGSFLIDAWNAEDMFIAKLNSTGNFVWAKHNSGSGVFTDEGTVISSDIVVDALGNIYTTGYFAGKVDFDPGPGETIFETEVTGGYSEWYKPHHDVDIFVSKLNSSGNLVWAKQMGGHVDDRANSIALDDNGNVYTTGYFSGNADFDPGPGKFKLNEIGGSTNDKYDAFISKLDGNGNFVWAGQLGGSDNERGITIATYGGNIYTTGDFTDECDFDPGSASFNLISAGGSDIFIHKMSQSGFTTQHNTTGNENITEAVDQNIRLYPNPTQGLVTITTKQNLANASFRLFNSSGQMMMEKKNISGSAYSFDISKQPAGVYYAEIINGGKKEGFKLVKH